jgi:hypothetical protein
MLVVLLHVPRGPFYSPKAARSRWRSNRKAILAFCRVVHRTVRCTTRHEQFMSGARSPSFSGEADRCSLGPLGAPDTVQCDHPTVGSATCRPLIAQTTVGRGPFGSPDSPVHTGQSGAHQTVWWIIVAAPSLFPESVEFAAGPAWALSTVRCTTGWCWFGWNIANFFSTSFPLFLAMSLVLR